MWYHGGTVGHKTTYEETKCLLNDHDALDKVPFELESERDWEDQRRGESSSDVEMGSGEDGDEMEEDGSDEEEASGEGTDRDEEGKVKQPNKPVYRALGNPTRGKVTSQK